MVSIFAPKVCLRVSQAKVSRILGHTILKTTSFAKNAPAIPLRRPAMSCDALRTFSATFSATPCDVSATCDIFWCFLADFVNLGHIFPIFWKMRGNVPKPQVSCMFGFHQVRQESGQGSLWQNYVAEQFGRIKLSHFDDLFVLRHNLIAHPHHFSFPPAPLSKCYTECLLLRTYLDLE